MTRPRITPTGIALLEGEATILMSQLDNAAKTDLKAKNEEQSMILELSKEQADAYKIVTKDTR